MLRDRSDPVDLFALVPQLDLEFEPQLAQLDRLLDDDEIFARVRADLARRSPLTPVHGRRSPPGEVILRMLVVRRLDGGSVAQTASFVNDRLVLRPFCRVSLSKVPDDTVLIRGANPIGPETLEQLHDRVVPRAQRLLLTRGRTLRVDTTAVETNIHSPSDSALLGDGVRVLSRRLRRAKTVLGAAAAGWGEAGRSRVRTGRTLSQQRHRIARRNGQEGREALKDASSRLIEGAKRTGAQAKRVRQMLPPQAGATATRLAARIGQFLPRLERGIGQAFRRVIQGALVPAGAKLLSLFEPPTQIIPRYQAGKPVEFGRKIRLDEVEGGLITGSRIVEPGGGQDQPYLAERHTTHRRHVGRAPDRQATDRGMASSKNEQLARDAGVRRVAMPSVGRASPERQPKEKAGGFRRGYRFRAGIEGRIHVLRRDFGLKRCRDQGERGMGRWVGWGIVTHNLSKIAEAGARR